uniref:(northern house mosquito) hypothetical protein n=1 Tax=Culex pipiens TaxID=7175 RepID=A0A8D8DNP0_CULPI
MFHRVGRSRCGRDYADNCALFPVLLSWLQNRRTVRGDDLPHGDGRSAPVRGHLLGVRDGLLPGLLHRVPVVQGRGGGRRESDAVADGVDRGHVSDVVDQLWRLLRRAGGYRPRGLRKGSFCDIHGNCGSAVGQLADRYDG